MSRKIPGPADREAAIAKMLARVEQNPGDELPYFEALVDVIEVIDLLDPHIRASALLSRVAVTAPWILDLVVRRCSH